MFKEKDIKLLKKRGIDIRIAEEQIEYLKKGFPFIRLAKAATIKQGIKKLDEKRLDELARKYDDADNMVRVKFIPASGAASRMFKALFEFDELFRQSNYDPKILNKDAYKHVKECFDRVRDFAFYRELEQAVLKSGVTLDKAMSNKNYHIILSSLLTGEGMNYGNLPKGLLSFHRYDHSVRTALEEHLVEGAGYALNKGRVVKIHLTVSPEHKNSFESLLKKVQGTYEERYRVKFDITFSIQKQSTDTLAIDDKNEPYRESDGSLHLRPGGHGALLDNLNEIESDLIFIKNIDNVTFDVNKTDTIKYKKALAGLLIDYQQKTFEYLKILEKPGPFSIELIKEIRDFLAQELGISIPERNLGEPPQAAELLYSKLNRPIRICGMVVNKSEPGGGPYWTTDINGIMSLQIIEASQVNHHDPEQEAILNSTTHFNPVDLVCGVKDYKRKKFNLMHYRDEKTGFISRKFKNGKPLKTIELPGLWNGSMSDWNTVFVEVPITTFTPVKTMHDLLRPEHQPQV